MDTQPQTRKPYATDVRDDEWACGAPSLVLVREDAPQRRHDRREVFTALRWLVHTGAPWRDLPGDLPPLGGGALLRLGQPLPALGQG